MKSEGSVSSSSIRSGEPLASGTRSTRAYSSRSGPPGTAARARRARSSCSGLASPALDRLRHVQTACGEGVLAGQHRALAYCVAELAADEDQARLAALVDGVEVGLDHQRPLGCEKACRMRPGKRGLVGIVHREGGNVERAGAHRGLQNVTPGSRQDDDVAGREPGSRHNRDAGGGQVGQIALVGVPFDDVGRIGQPRHAACPGHEGSPGARCSPRYRGRRRDRRPPNRLTRRPRSPGRLRCPARGAARAGVDRRRRDRAARRRWPIRCAESWPQGRRWRRLPAIRSGSVRDRLLAARDLRYGSAGRSDRGRTGCGSSSLGRARPRGQSSTDWAIAGRWSS